MIFPFVCLFVDGHLGYFHSVVNNAAINIHVQVFVWKYIFICLVYIPKSRIAKSYVNSVFINLLTCQTLFQSGYNALHSHQKCMRIPVSLHFNQSCLGYLFIVATLLCMKWHLSVSLMFISLMTIDVEHLFMWLLPTSIYTLEIWLFRFCSKNKKFN